MNRTQLWILRILLAFFVQASGTGNRGRWLHVEAF